MRRGRDGGCEIFSSLGAEAVEGRRVGSRVINCDAFVSSMCIDIIRRGRLPPLREEAAVFYGCELGGRL